MGIPSLSTPPHTPALQEVAQHPLSYRSLRTALSPAFKDLVFPLSCQRDASPGTAPLSYSPCRERLAVEEQMSAPQNCVPPSA